MRIMVTGGAGFIGSALVRRLIATTDHSVLNFDKLTYAGHQESLGDALDHPRHRFVHGDVCEPEAVRAALGDFRPDVVVHLAAETHVDRSIAGPHDFVRTNVEGTFVMVSEALNYWRALPSPAKNSFRFHHVSTDEVFGSLGPSGAFVESSPYSPNSPYSATKAAADHLVRAWGHTYGLPTLITNCSNNYGPFHHPEKLAPRMIVNALTGRPLPVYGQGTAVRDWLHVDDHARALIEVFQRGRAGETYLVAGGVERHNLEVVRTICTALDRHAPRGDGRSHALAITHVADRPGHDARYALDAAKLRRDLGWEPRIDFASGIDSTVRWYVDNPQWWRPLIAAESVDAPVNQQSEAKP